MNEAASFLCTDSPLVTNMSTFSGSFTGARMKTMPDSVYRFAIIEAVYGKGQIIFHHIISRITNAPHRHAGAIV